jgi:arylsulfatase A-like enzyme
MDASIGKIIDVLEQKQLLDNTIVIFFSDNGGSGGADNSPLRGHKSQMWEGGIRVPCLVRWPAGKVPAGAVNDQFLSSLELFPSLAAATGALTRSDVSLDGFDWWATLRSESESPRKEMFWKRQNLAAARVGKWKWVDMGGESGGLFDLDADVGESNNLSQSRPEILRMVKDRYERWLGEMAASPPRGPFRDF